MRIAGRPVEAAPAAEIARAIPAAAWKTLRVSHSFHRPDGERVKLFQPSTNSGEAYFFPTFAQARPCPNPPCVPCGQVVDLRPYFIPNYSGWQTAKRIWTYKGGGTTCFRMFKYSGNDYELIKSCDGKSTETFEVTNAGIFVTSEMGTPLGSQARLFPGDGLLFLPAQICTNRNTFQVCDDGQTFVNNSSCLTTGSNPPHCATYRSRIEFEPNWNYGGYLGVVDSIIKIDTLDNGEVEKYWFGKNRGILRWEHRSASGSLLNWGQQTGEVPNSAIQHNSCYQPL